MAERDDIDEVEGEFDEEWDKLTGEVAADVGDDDEPGDEPETGSDGEGDEGDSAGGESDQGAPDADDKDKSEDDQGEDDSAEGVDKSDDSSDNADEQDNNDPLVVAQRKIKELEHKANSERGRHAGAQRQLQQLRAEKAELEAKMKKAPAELPDDWKELQEKFPAIAKAVESRLDSERVELLDQIKDLKEQNSKNVKELRNRDNWAYLDEHNPGWRDTIATKEFKDWYAKQSENIKNLYSSEDVADNSELLRQYEGSLPTPPATKPAAADEEGGESPDVSTKTKRQKQLESNTKVSSSAVDVEDLGDDDFDSAFAEASKKADKRLRERF